MLEAVKKLLGITGTYQDDTISGYIAEVQQFMLEGGVDSTFVEDEVNAGVIARGVADLWNYGSSGTSLSTYFIQRVTQLALKEVIIDE